MPTYVYEAIVPDGAPAPTFEFQQRMSDPPLTTHPETGQPIRRIMTAPNLGGVAAGREAAPSACSFAGGCGLGPCGSGACGDEN
ncbi:MAG: hypothetical protein KBG28_31340 [Kofleriaceae bacterium]|jgi:hypothetical protein|nr:hypothetical protein [Kofleriaceae bacterium]